jgi:hypothetical protein
MVAVVGRRVVDRPLVRMIAKSLAACLVVVVVDRVTASLGWARMVVDVIAYLAVVVATGALRIGETWKIATTALRARGRAQV